MSRKEKDFKQEFKPEWSKAIHAEALPDLRQDAKAWPILQAILHPQPTSVEIDPDLLCPITTLLIRDPVTTVDGQMYEREAIEKWLRQHNTAPLTNQPLPSKQLTPSPFAKKQIAAFVDRNPLLKESEEWYLPESWMTALKTACKNGDEKQIREWVGRDRRLLVHSFKSYGNQTALHFAVQHPKSLEMVIELLESRQRGLGLAALLRPDSENLLPIHRAVLAQQDARTLLKLMSRMGKQIAAIHSWPEDGLREAMDRHSLNEALTECVAQEDLEKIACLLRLGADPETKNADGETLVYQAVKKQLPRSLVVLLHAGATDRALANGRTALHLAAERNADGLLEILAEDKALPPARCESKDAEGCTPLHRAAASGAVAALVWLFDQGADVQAINAKGETALHLAARANQPEALALLLERGFSLNAIDSDGNTALHTAAASGTSEAVVTLLKAGIAPNLKNKAGYTARQLAEKSGYTGMIQQLDQTMRELQAVEQKALREQGVLGVFLWKQQQIIQNQEQLLQEQQERIGQQHAEIKVLKSEIAQLKKELLPPSEIKRIILTEISIFKEKKEDKISLPLQEALVKACERGMLDEVQTELKKGARPDARNSTGKHPLGAAVWGMNPEVVNALLQQMSGVSPMTWEECEAHNRKHYREVFIITEFKPETFGEWHQLLLKMDPNPFIRAFHLKKADDLWHDNDTSSWENLKHYVEAGGSAISNEAKHAVVGSSEQGYVSFRTQIKQAVESAKSLSMEQAF